MTIVVSTGVIVPVVTIGPMAIIVVSVSPVEVTSRAMRTVASTSLRRMMFLVRDVRVGPVTAKLPLAVFFLPDVVAQCDCLIKQRLVVGCIGHKQWYQIKVSKIIMQKY